MPYDMILKFVILNSDIFKLLQSNCAAFLGRMIVEKIVSTGIYHSHVYVYILQLNFPALIGSVKVEKKVVKYGNFITGCVDQI